MTAARKPRPVTRVALPLRVIHDLINEHNISGEPITWDELVAIEKQRKPRRGELPEIIDVRNYDARIAEWAASMRVAEERKRSHDLIAFDTDDEVES